MALPGWAQLALGTLVAIVGGGLLGFISVIQGSLVVVALLVGLVGLTIVLSDVRAGLWAAIGVTTLLPFAVIPVRVGLTLTLLEAASLATLGVWVLTLFLRRNERIVSASPAMWIGLLLTVTLFALLLGLGRGYTTQTFHDYGKFVLATLLVYAVWNSTRSLADARRLVAVLLLGAGTASAIGLGLYAGGPSLTLKALSRLIPYGYPSSQIVRYIEDNPEKPMRLVSTSVDPNSFGGLLAVVFVIAVAQVIARHPLFPRKFTIPVAALIAGAMLLTYSRGSWVSATAGLGILALLRYRWLIAPGAIGAGAVLALGLGSHFVHRLWLGFTLQDPATKLRLAEYRNALAIIRQHPVFGVGFGDAPSIELQTGVSSIYLTIAERAGVVGLVVYLTAVASVALAGLRYWRRRQDSPEGDLTLALLAALGAALMVGLVDHYFFNISFPHMAALFWTVCGLILALALPPSRYHPRKTVEHRASAERDVTPVE